MSANDIIKGFDVNSITRDDINLYLNFIIDRKKGLSRKAKYIKVCVELTENVTSTFRTNNNLSDPLSLRFRSKSRPSGLNLYRFEDNILDLAISEDEVSIFKEYPVVIPINKVREVVKTQQFIREKLHTFKVYILDKNKSVLEKHSYNSPYEIEEYTFNVDGNTFVFESLESSADLVFTPYDNNFNLGPYLNISSQFALNPAIDLSLIDLEVVYNEETYNFNNIITVPSVDAREISTTEESVLGTPETNLSVNSFPLVVDDFEDNTSADSLTFPGVFNRGYFAREILKASNPLIPRLFEKFSKNNLNSDIIIFKLSFRDSTITKEKTIDKSIVNSLYNSYFKKNKQTIINNIFSGKINIVKSIDQFGFKISFKKYDSYLIPESVDKNCIKIYKVSSSIRKSIDSLYTSTSYDEDLKLSTYNNRGFLVESIYENPNKDSTFFIKNGTTSEFQVYYGDIVIFEISPVIDGDESVIARSLANDFDAITDLNPFVDSCFKNPRLLGANRLLFDFDRSEIGKKLKTASQFGYTNRENENLFDEIINNILVLCTVSKNIPPIDCEIPIRLRDILENNIISFSLPFAVQANGVINVSIKSIFLPFEMSDRIISGSGSDDDKETISEFLNKITLNSYSSIDTLINNFLFSSKPIQIIIEEMFLVIGSSIPESSFLIRRELSREIDTQSLLDNVRLFENSSGI